MFSCNLPPALLEESQDGVQKSEFLKMKGDEAGNYHYLLTSLTPNNQAKPVHGNINVEDVYLAQLRWAYDGYKQWGKTND